MTGFVVLHTHEIAGWERRYHDDTGRILRQSKAEDSKFWSILWQR